MVISWNAVAVMVNRLEKRIEVSKWTREWVLAMQQEGNHGNLPRGDKRSDSNVVIAILTKVWVSTVDGDTVTSKENSAPLCVCICECE